MAEKTKISIEIDGIKISAEKQKHEISPADAFELFRAVFLGATFTWEQWHAELKNQIAEGE